MQFDDRYFYRLDITKEQTAKNLQNAEKDLIIAKKDKILDVKFNYAYTALLKMGIALLSFYHMKMRNASGHHIKTIEKMAEILKDETISDIGNVMRSKRNFDLYGGGIEVTAKECREYVDFVEGVYVNVKKIIRL